MEQKEIYIETERIIIRNFKQKDAEGLLEYLSHPRVNCFAGDIYDVSEGGKHPVYRYAKPIFMGVSL